jgi:hypothetical protein
MLYGRVSVDCTKNVTKELPGLKKTPTKAAKKMKKSEQQ